MAHGFNSYTQPKYGNLSAYIGGKIKDAAMMAGQERVSRQEEVEQLQKKYDAGKASQDRTIVGFQRGADFPSVPHVDFSHNGTSDYLSSNCWNRGST